MGFHFTHIDSYTVRCEHQGEMSLEDWRELKAFLRTYDGVILIDWSGTPSGDCARLLLTVRAMLPRTAICGEPLPGYVFKPLPGKDFYKNEVRWFDDETDALDWLRSEPHIPIALQRASIIEAGHVNA